MPEYSIPHTHIRSQVHMRLKALHLVSLHYRKLASFLVVNTLIHIGLLNIWESKSYDFVCQEMQLSNSARVNPSFSSPGTEQTSVWTESSAEEKLQNLNFKHSIDSQRYIAGDGGDREALVASGSFQNSLTQSDRKSVV